MSRCAGALNGGIAGVALLVLAAGLLVASGSVAKAPPRAAAVEERSRTLEIHVEGEQPGDADFADLPGFEAVAGSTSAAAVSAVASRGFPD